LASLWHSFAQLADPVNRGVEGLGLGLALVNYIIKAHNGDVFATSKLGKGSTFGFHLLYNNLANGEPGTYI
jgi:signal transduction histidine kinase